MLTTLFVLLLAPLLQHAGVSDPRPDGWVSDHANVLDHEAEARLDAIAAEINRDLGAQLVVVTVDHVSGSPKHFASELFAAWQIGSALRDDGALVLLVTGRRRLEVETGIGLEEALPAAWLADLQASKMLPAFRQGDYGAGLISGLDSIARRLRAPVLEAGGVSEPGEYRSDGGVVSPAGAEAPASELPRAPWPYAEVATPGGESDLVVSLRAAALTGLAIVGLFFGVGYGTSAVHRRRRRCATCRVQMVALAEAGEDKHLISGQQTEERLSAVDYQVLVCPGCQTSRVIARPRWRSGRTRCPACGFKTATSSAETLSYADYDHGGEVRVTVTCANCSQTTVTTETTPPRDRSEASGASDSGPSGGRSRGGGAGSSW